MQKSKIDNTFIQKAKDIRYEYLRCIDNINLDTDKLLITTSKLQELLKVGDDILNNIKDKESDEYKNNFKEIVDNITMTIQDIEKHIKPYQNRIKELEKESDLLYVSIKERYPELETEDIKNQIIPNLDK